jgi:hypothetical protein|tara:strand:- start:674 stop:1300 length:627 start_codon:yes stop_codon:yes gene_type:complete
MNLFPSTHSSRFNLKKADHIGIAASVLCAIHCAVAPFIILLLPTFGKIWAHPLSHIIVAMLVAPLAAFSIRRGYLSHKKRWVLITAYVGIIVILSGAALPAFSKETETSNTITINIEPESKADSVFTFSVTDDASISESDCDNTLNETSECIDNCCPSLQISETGETHLNVPPAAIITTLGGIFLIVAHVGNLCACGHSCRTGKCRDC